MNDVSHHRPGVSRRWLPNDEETLLRWHGVVREAMQEHLGDPPHPVILEFRQMLEEDPVSRMYLVQMIEQIPARYRDHHPRNPEEFLRQLNAVLRVAPPYVPQGQGEATALVGTPFSAILIWTMGTPAGFAAYRHPPINAMFRKLLCVWTGFLDSSESLDVLNDSPTGWMCPEAQAQLHMQDYRYQPEAPYWGFGSWNAFFTRRLAEGARPVSDQDNPRVITAACDSTVYRVARDVQAHSEFWIKAQPYSLADMLDGHHVAEFVGGDVWQAFLSPFNYHRWHSPVSGRIRKAWVKEGLYFSQADVMGEDPSDQDHSEGYIAQVQTRAIFFIDADDPRLGLVCVIPIGMVEISSCVIDERLLQPGAPIRKGEELGYFQFGGSTHCVLFQPGVIERFTAFDNDEVQVGQQIALARD